MRDDKDLYQAYQKEREGRGVETVARHLKVSLNIDTRTVVDREIQNEQGRLEALMQNEER